MVTTWVVTPDGRAAECGWRPRSGTRAAPDVKLLESGNGLLPDWLSLLVCRLCRWAWSLPEPPALLDLGSEANSNRSAP